MEKEKGKTICIYSPKGGVGKSVISANLAGVSFLMGKKTLLIDADVYDGCLSLYIDSDISKTLYNLVDDMKNNKFDNILNYVYNYNENLDIICAPKIQIQADTIKDKYIEKIINLSKDIYDFIVIDTNPSYNDLNEKIFNCVDETVLILTNDMYNIKNMKNIISIFKKSGIENYKVLLNTSFDFKDPYFSNYEIIDMIGSNIDYSLDREAFFKNITMYIYNSCIPILYKDNDVKYYKVIERLMLIIRDLYKGEE